MANNGKVTIYCVMIATLICGFWGLFFSAPGLIKFTFAILIYLSVFFFPYMNLITNDYCFLGKSLLYLLLSLCVYEILVTVVNTQEDMYLVGNKWTTLFLNEYCALTLFPPLYAFLATAQRNFFFLGKAICVYLIIASSFCLFLKFYCLAFGTLFLLPFLPYVSRKHKYLIVFAIIISLVYALRGSRMMFIVLAFISIAIITVYVSKYKLIRVIVASFVLILPFLMFIPILAAEPGELTFFQKIQEFVASLTSDNSMSVDTRTFLYLEMADDLSATDSWWLGKGAYSHYTSTFFDSGSSKNLVGRISSEVPFLNFLQHGGIVYVIAYFGFFILAIIRSLFYGKSQYIKLISILLCGWFLNSFMGDIVGCRFYHLVIFFFAGCCMSKRWLNYSDLEIQALIDDQFKKIQIIKCYLVLKLLSKKYEKQ